MEKITRYVDASTSYDWEKTNVTTLNKSMLVKHKMLTVWLIW